jgi:hypothetical protein
VEIDFILKRFSEGLKYVDSHTTHVSANRRNGEIYLPGVKTMTERQLVKELVEWWGTEHSEDFSPKNALYREVPYSNIPRASCDLKLSSDGTSGNQSEWAIEVKHIALVGNNGKNNDYGVAKILSPYLKDRSLIHDIYRIREHGEAKRKAVIGYCFSYDSESCIDAKKLHPNHLEYIENIEQVCKTNDPVGKQYSVLPMVEFANDIFKQRGLVHDLQVVHFDNVWRHPCGGKGVVFGWELTSLQD